MLMLQAVNLMSFLLNRAKQVTRLFCIAIQVKTPETFELYFLIFLTNMKQLIQNNDSTHRQHTAHIIHDSDIFTDSYIFQLDYR
jgi:hypothetical protein